MTLTAVQEAADVMHAARLAFDEAVNNAMAVGSTVRFSYGPRRSATAVIERRCHLGVIYARNIKTHEAAWIDPRRVFEVLP